MGYMAALYTQIYTISIKCKFIFTFIKPMVRKIMNTLIKVFKTIAIKFFVSVCHFFLSSRGVQFVCTYFITELVTYFGLVYLVHSSSGTFVPFPLQFHRLLLSCRSCLVLKRHACYTSGSFKQGRICVYRLTWIWKSSPRIFY